METKVGVFEEAPTEHDLMIGEYQKLDCLFF